MAIEDKKGAADPVTKAGMKRLEERQRFLIDKMTSPVPHPEYIQDPHAIVRVQHRVVSKELEHARRRLDRLDGQAREDFNTTQEKSKYLKSLQNKFDHDPQG